MKHISIPLESPCELINITPFNPLISKCTIKVCYVGDDPNRNRSIITKDSARKIANSLPGSPIVGIYDKDSGDFTEHRAIEMKNGKIRLVDNSRAYGFVDLSAKVWFQKFVDDGVTHEYLMTEGWLWTGQYPEAQQVYDEGKGQSMELEKEKFLKAFWSKNEKGAPQFFIINEAVIEKLCILGDDYEPCFEGASITKETKPLQFSYEEKFKDMFFALRQRMQKEIKKGGTLAMDNENVDTIVDTEPVELTTETVEEVVEFAAEETVTEPEEVVETTPIEEVIDTIEEEPTEEESAPIIDEAIDTEVEVQVTYDLNSIPEYVELSTKYTEAANALHEATNKIATLEQEIATFTKTTEETTAALNAELETLRQFKVNVERKEKEAMIKSFYMLSDNDKADVIAHIDEYSLNDIEAKLSIICVRNKVNFNLDNEDKEDKTFAATSYTLESPELEGSMPAWIRAAKLRKENN